MIRNSNQSAPAGAKGPGWEQVPSGWRPYLLRESAAWLPWLCATTSIASLLLYLSGLVELRASAQALLLPGLASFAGFWLWIQRGGEVELRQRLAHGCWAGLVATFVYDLVRVPMARLGVPVFKAISYFGTVFLGEPAPTPASEIVGWTYHLSNGIGLALMYVLWVNRPAWWTAVLWGLTLEGVMLLTPYAEVFGYKMSRQFLGITIGAHVVYGLGLWGGLKFQAARQTFASRWPWCRHLTRGVILGVPLGLIAIAADFHAHHARAIPPSPPEYVGPHLYTTWDVLEPDRMAAAWIWSRFVDKRARFHFIPSFSRITRGKPFDVPEAEIRRTGTRSATEVLLARHQLEGDPKLALLGRAAHVYEITPWQLGTDPEASEVGRQLKQLGIPHANSTPAQLAQTIFAWLDEWFARPLGTNAPGR